jgi:hypothetical protein
VGARRTETAYPRFVQAQNGYDLMTGGFGGKVNPQHALAQMEAMPEVAQWARVDVAAYDAILPSGRLAPLPELMATTDLMGRAGFRLNRFKVISGRMADRRAPGEAVIDFATADREDLRVGSVVRFIVGITSACTDETLSPTSWSPPPWFDSFFRPSLNDLHLSDLELSPCHP